jgi:hypothetical protein
MALGLFDGVRKKQQQSENEQSEAEKAFLEANAREDEWIKDERIVSLVITVQRFSHGHEKGRELDGKPSDLQLQMQYEDIKEELKSVDTEVLKEASEVIPWILDDDILELKQRQLEAEKEQESDIKAQLKKRMSKAREKSQDRERER